MKKELIQALIDQVVEKRVFASFPNLKKGFTTSQSIEEFKKSASSSEIDFIRLAKEVGQDPEEIKKMTMESFDKAIQKLRERFVEVFDKVVIPMFNNK